MTEMILKYMIFFSTYSKPLIVFFHMFLKFLGIFIFVVIFLVQIYVIVVRNGMFYKKKSSNLVTVFYYVIGNVYIYS